MYILFIGDTFVGKTSLLNNLMGKIYEENPKLTIGYDIHPISINSREIYCIDTGEYYISEPIVRDMLPFVSGIVIVYDITSRSSLYYAMELYDKYKDRYYRTIILGNKCDNTDEEQFTNEHTIKVSAKTGQNVRFAINKLFEPPKTTSPKTKDHYCCQF